MRLKLALTAALLSAPALAQSPKAVVTLAHASGNDALANDVPHTLGAALGVAYETNPQLTGERAHLRSVDEGVPAALAGWRPTISVGGSYGYSVGRFDTTTLCTSPDAPAACRPNPFYPNGQARTVPISIQNNRTTSQVQAQLTQYLYRGGKTTAATHQAVNNVYAERARLMAEEQTVFGDTVTAYVTYIADQQLLALDQANQYVLRNELQATNDRFRVGELTRTDVAQAEAALAQAIATVQTGQGNLQTARATFVRQVGVLPANDLADPQPLVLPVASEQEAADLASRNNPNVIAALFNESQARDAMDVAFSNLGPQLSIQATAADTNSPSLAKQSTYGETAVMALTMPIYQGGAEYAAIRQARQNYTQARRQTEDTKRAAVEQAVQAWDTLAAARAAIGSSKTAVQTSQIAVEGVEREAIVGSLSTTDVLVAQQNLLTAEITLVNNVASMVNASYGVASAIGRLTARDLSLPVPMYDETAYYNAVRDRLWGTGDRAVNQPGR